MPARRKELFRAMFFGAIMPAGSMIVLVVVGSPGRFDAHSKIRGVLLAGGSASPLSWVIIACPPLRVLAGRF
jgi:hypothetical protein